jgi:hypothetical protein
MNRYNQQRYKQWVLLHEQARQAWREAEKEAHQPEMQKEHATEERKELPPPTSVPSAPTGEEEPTKEVL